MINELEKLKLNTNNINSVLLTSKKRVQKINLERKKFILTKNEKIKKENKEKKLESQKSPFGKSIKKINICQYLVDYIINKVILNQSKT